MGGFGTGIILAAALAPLIGVKALVPVMAVAGVIINAGRFWFYRDSLERRTLGVVLARALPFLMFGTWLYSVLDARSVGTMLGIAVIASVPLRRILRKKAVMLGTPGLAVGSSIFGLASGLATGTGVILVSLLLGTRHEPARRCSPPTRSCHIALDLSKARALPALRPPRRAGLLHRRGDRRGEHPGKRHRGRAGDAARRQLHVVFIETLIVVGGASMLWHSWR